MSAEDGLQSSTTTTHAEPIASAAAALALVERMARAPALALDTEGDGMFRYRTRLCTLQLGGAGEIAVVDTLQVAAAPLFCELLGARGPEKIIHDASFDARVLFAHGVEVGRVFDTAVAARFLGIAATGLSSLLLKFFGIHLPKHQQQADWGLRPIDAEAMRYLEDDVRYLPALAACLLEQVRASDIEPEVREECGYVLSEARQTDRAQEAAWMRMKGAAQRPANERARLFELAEEREQLAQQLDLPPARFVPNECLLALARERPSSAPEVARLLRTRGPAVDARGSARELAVDARGSTRELAVDARGSTRELAMPSDSDYAQRFLAALARADAHSDAPPHQVAQLAPAPPSAAQLARRKRRRAGLLEFRARHAQQRAVDLQVVLPGHCLGDMLELASLDAAALLAVPGFGACRVERYAELLAAELGARWAD